MQQPDDASHDASASVHAAASRWGVGRITSKPFPFAVHAAIDADPPNTTATTRIRLRNDGTVLERRSIIILAITPSRRRASP
jgi:hypothetical protein